MLSASLTYHVNIIQHGTAGEHGSGGNIHKTRIRVTCGPSGLLLDELIPLRYWLFGPEIVNKESVRIFLKCNTDACA